MKTPWTSLCATACVPKLTRAEVSRRWTYRSVEDLVLEVDLIVRTWRSKTASEIQGKVKARLSFEDVDFCWLRNMDSSVGDL